MFIEMRVRLILPVSDIIVSPPTAFCGNTSTNLFLRYRLLLLLLLLAGCCSSTSHHNTYAHANRGLSSVKEMAGGG